MPKNSPSHTAEQKQPRDPADDAAEALENGADEVANAGADNPADARKNPEKLVENRRKLGVDETHETPVMKERRRGTFP